MSLKESLAKFQRQHEKCQSTLSSIASEKQAAAKATAPSKSSYNVQKSTATVTRPPPPVVKFSNDTERLQFINNIRKSPAGAQLKRVIDLLLEVSYFSVAVCLSIYIYIGHFGSIFCITYLG